MKRPWSSGPWSPKESNNVYWQISPLGSKNHDNNLKLASKAPDMAELLIEFLNACEEACYYLAGDSIYRNHFSEIAQDATKLLKEVGYETTDPR